MRDQNKLSDLQATGIIMAAAAVSALTISYSKAVMDNSLRSSLQTVGQNVICSSGPKPECFAVSP